MILKGLKKNCEGKERFSKNLANLILFLSIYFPDMTSRTLGVQWQVLFKQRDQKKHKRISHTKKTKQYYYRAYSIGI